MSTNSTAREVPSALAWGLVSKVFVSALAFVSNILIVRGLGDELYGDYAIFLQIARFLALAIGFGLAQAILQFLPEMRVKENATGARQLLSRAILFQVAAWFVVLLAVYAARGWIDGFFDGDLRGILLLGTVFLICEVFWGTMSHICMAIRRMRALTIVSVLQKIVLIGLLSWLWWTGVTIARVVVVVGVSFLISALLLWSGMRGQMPWLKGSGVGLPTARIMRYAGPIALGALINQILWRSSEVLILGHFWASEEAGYFNLAYNLPQMILEFIPLAIWPIILASLSEVHSRQSQDLARGVVLYFRLLCVLVLPLVLTGVVLGGAAFLLFYGAEFAAGAPICQIFFGIFLLSFLVTPMRMALFVKERVWPNILVASVGAVINVGLDLLLIPRYGLWGAVPPVAIALLVTGILQIIVTRRLLPGMTVPWSYFFRVLLGSAVVVPLWFVRGALTSPLWLLLALVGGTLAQFLVLRALRVVGEQECEMLRKSNLPFKGWIVRLLAPGATAGED